MYLYVGVISAYLVSVCYFLMLYMCLFVCFCMYLLICMSDRVPVMLIINLVTVLLCTSGFWPRVRARAVRAPVFLG